MHKGELSIIRIGFVLRLGILIFCLLGAGLFFVASCYSPPGQPDGEPLSAPVEEDEEEDVGVEFRSIEDEEADLDLDKELES